MLLPPEAAPLLALFAAEFSAPTAARFHTLFAAALLTAELRNGVLLVRRLLAMLQAPARTISSSTRAGGEVFEML